MSNYERIELGSYGYGIGLKIIAYDSNFAASIVSDKMFTAGGLNNSLFE